MNITSARHTVELTNEEFVDLVDTAGYGIAYWAAAPCIVDDEADPPTYTVNHPEEPRAPREERLFDLEKSQPGDQLSTVLTPNDLARACEALLDGRVQVADYIVGYIRNDDIDSVAGDTIVQVAIFGKLVFG